MLSFVLAQLLVQFQKPAIVTDFKNNNNNNSEDGAVGFVPLQSNHSIHHVWNNAFSLAIMLVVISFISILFQHHCYVGSNLLGVRLRIACSSLMYRKVINISNFLQKLFDVKCNVMNSLFSSECSIICFGCKSNRHWSFGEFDVK